MTIIVDDQLDRDERLRVTGLELAIAYVNGIGGGPPMTEGDTPTSAIAELARGLSQLGDEFVKYIEDGLPAPAPEVEDEDFDDEEN